MSEFQMCPCCESEFKIIESSANRLTPSYCPYCGGDLTDTDEVFDDDDMGDDEVFEDDDY